MKKKIIWALLSLMIIMSISVLADCKVSLRGDLTDSGTYVWYKGYDASDVVKGSVNTYILINEGVLQSQGELIAKVGKDRLSVNWDSKGNDYGTTLYQDTNFAVYFTGHARVIENGKSNFEPVYIVYYKGSHYMYVYGHDYGFGFKTEVQ
jgi:hypothetical protein